MALIMDPIQFQLYDWIEDHSNDDENNNYIIHSFGRCENGKSVYAKITGFTPYFYILLPDVLQKKSTIYLLDFLKKLLITLKDKYNKKIFYKYKKFLNKIDLVELKSAEGFTNDETRYYARLIFSNSEGMRGYRFYLQDNDITVYDSEIKNFRFKLYEANFPPLLRCFHMRNISGCSWIETTSYELITDDKESRCDIEIIVKWSEIIPIEKNFNAPLRICSFDIECNSIDGEFPQAKRPGDYIIQIGMTYTYLGESIPYRQYIGCLKDTCSVDNTIVESFSNERDLLLGFLKEINDNDCDIITGYNIFFFDEKYIYDRAKEILHIDNELAFMSKLINYKCKWQDFKLSSSALGDNILRYWNTPGRVHVDLMKDIQKTSLPSYKLDYVASKYIRGEIIKYNKLENDIIEFQCKSIQDINVGDYIHIEVIKGFVSDEVGEKYMITDLDIKNNTIQVKGNNYLIQELESIKSDNEFNCCINWSQAKDDVGPKEIFKLFRGSAQDRALIAKYCIKDCRLVSLLINKLEIITKNLEMANVCFVPLSYLFTRGQGIKLFSLCLKEFRKQRYAFPVITKKEDKEFEGDNNSYEGAIVFDPMPKVEYEALAVKDYMSLYPASIMHKNMSHETIVENQKYDNLPGIKYYNAQFRESDGSIQYRRFAQINNKLGVIPTILDNLLNERKKIKKQIKNEKDQFRYKILDAKQLAVKITANSLYGQLGASTSQIFKRDIAACTTSTGREMLILAKKYDEEKLPWIINSLKYFYKYNEQDKINKLYDLELKSRNDNDLIESIKKYVTTDINDKIFQPIVRYGDSVIGKTPLLLKYDNKIYITHINKLFNNEYIIREDGKEYINIHDIETWTEKGWTKIIRIIRHKLDKSKKLYRVSTYMGNIVVTDDHSLLSLDGTEIKPNNLKIGDELLHSYPTKFENINFNTNYDINQIKYFNDEIEALEYYTLCKINNINVEVSFDNNYYIINQTDKQDNRIKNINLYEESEDYVYDLTTDNHHFHAGVGSLIVHNTDSIFSCYRFRENAKILDTNTALNIWIKVVNFAKILIKPFMEKNEYKIFEDIFDTYYSNIMELKLPKITENIEIPSQSYKIISLENRIKLFIREYMEENYIPWLWTLTDIVENNSIEMFESKLILWAEYLLTNARLTYENLYESRKQYLIDPILNYMNNIFKNNKYIIPSDHIIEDFVQKFVKNDSCFPYVNEIKLSLHKLKELCKNLLVKTIKEKWIFSNERKELNKLINQYLSDTMYNFNEYSKNNDIYIIINYIITFISNDMIDDTEKKVELLINNIINDNNFGMLFNENNMKIHTKLFIDKYNKNNGAKTMETIIQEFLERDLNLSFNSYKNKHYNKIINFVNDNLRILDMSLMDKDNQKYINYWIQPRWNFNTNYEKEYCIDIYECGDKITDQRTLQYTIELGKLSGELIKLYLPFPHDCEYEKTYWPFVILTKKKYVGNKYEFDINKFKQDFMGIVLKRRDNAAIVKEICGGIIDNLINHRDPIGAKEFVKKCLQNMFDGKYDIKYFLQSRKLKLKDSYKDWTKLAHVYLADKINKRDPGNTPQSGDRIEFAVVKIQNNGVKLLQGDIIETPEYIKDNNLEIDYLFYLTNQIKKPALQFLELVDKDSINIFNEFINKYSIIKQIKEKEKLKKLEEKNLLEKIKQENKIKKDNINKIKGFINEINTFIKKTNVEYKNFYQNYKINTNKFNNMINSLKSC